MIELGARLADLLGRVDDVLSGLDLAAALDEVGHVCHDGAHVLRQHHYVVVAVLPLRHLERKVTNFLEPPHLFDQLVLLLREALHGAAAQGGG